MTIQKLTSEQANPVMDMPLPENTEFFFQIVVSKLSGTALLTVIPEMLWMSHTKELPVTIPTQLHPTNHTSLSTTQLLLQPTTNQLHLTMLKFVHNVLMLIYIYFLFMY